MPAKKKVVILIPTHRSNITPDDEVSLMHLKKYLPNYDTFFVIPKKLDSKPITARGYKIKKVDNNYFGTLRKANEALLNKKFYEEFKKYDFMLIYQLDALVFSKDLDKWVNSGYDFIAAPWFRSVIGYLSHGKNSPASGGNGGFSLRNIKKAIKIIDLVNKQASRSAKEPWRRYLWFIFALLTGRSHQIWLNAPISNYPFNEDGFWSLEASKYDPTYKVPKFKEALKFGFERNPRKCFELNKRKLPFGAHAWKKYDAEFWKPFLLKKFS